MSVSEQTNDKLEAHFSKQTHDNDDIQQDELTIDAIAERKLLRKCDLNVLPSIMLIFFLAFLDRTNIGMPLLCIV
jgi:hypothetical protein